MELVCGSIGKATSVDGGTVSVDASNARGGSSIVSIGNRPPVVPVLGRPDGGSLSHVFLPAGALERLRRYAGVCTVDACVRRSLPAECLEA